MASMKQSIRKWRRRNPGYELAMVFFNAMGSSGVKPERSARISQRAIRRSRTRPDVVAGVECQVLPDPNREVWEYVHDADEDKAGLFFAVRRTRGRVLNVEWILGTPRAFDGHEAEQMLNRWIMLVTFVVDESTDREHVYKIAVFHMPPKRNWRWFWDRMARQIKDLDADFYVSDWNKLARAVVALLGLRTDMVHIVGWASRWRWPVEGPFGINAGADHAALGVVVWKGRGVAPK